jgi:hypothetical protein
MSDPQDIRKGTTEDNNSIVDEMLSGYVERAIHWVGAFVQDKVNFARLLRDVPQMVKDGLHHLGPATGGALIGKFAPKSVFGSTTAAHVLKNGALYAVRYVSDAINRGVDIDSEEFAEEFEAMLENYSLLIDPKDRYEYCHDPECAKMKQIIASYDNDKKKKWQHQLPVKILFKDALDQGLSMAPCCGGAIQKKLEAPEKPAPAPAPQKVKPPQSFVEKFGQFTVEQQARIIEALLIRDEEERKTFMAGIIELDPGDEANGFMAIPDELLDLMLPHLVNKSPEKWLNDHLAEPAKELREFAEEYKQFATTAIVPVQQSRPKRFLSWCLSALWFLLAMAVPVGRRR